LPLCRLEPAAGRRVEGVNDLFADALDSPPDKAVLTARGLRQSIRLDPELRLQRVQPRRVGQHAFAVGQQAADAGEFRLHRTERNSGLRRRQRVDAGADLVVDRLDDTVTSTGLALTSAAPYPAFAFRRAVACRRSRSFSTFGVDPRALS
jgi:hypothetical protein